MYCVKIAQFIYDQTYIKCLQLTITNIVALVTLNAGYHHDNKKKKVCYDMFQDNILISRLSKLLGNDQCSNNSCNNTLRRLT